MRPLWNIGPRGIGLRAVVDRLQPVGVGPTWTVAALLLAAGDSLAARFGALTVRGELSGFTRAASGHCYFALKDSDGAPALLRCAMFRRVAAMLDFAPRDGMQLELRGRIGVFESRGELQVVAESLRRVGAGTLYEEFLRLRARLEAQGWFDAARKRPIVALPRCVAIVTSPMAAALDDVLTAFRRRAPHVRLVLVPSAVQGAEAPPQLAAALQRAGGCGAETVLLVRGGGSLEDLWAFNDERVVQAVARCAVPVICGVGHEGDVTLADLAADLRAPTPTAAAELAAGERGDLAQALQRRMQALDNGLRRSLERTAQRLDALALRLVPAATAVATERERLQLRENRLRAAIPLAAARGQQTLAAQSARLARTARVRVQASDAHLRALQARLQSLDPRQVLQRGFVWVEDARARPVVSVASLAPRDRVRAVWADGTAEAEVIKVAPAVDAR